MCYSSIKFVYLLKSLANTELPKTTKLTYILFKNFTTAIGPRATKLSHDALKFETVEI